MYTYQNIIGFPPAPAQPVHFQRITEDMVTLYRQRGWAFEYAQRLTKAPHASYKVIEWALRDNKAAQS